MIHHNFDPIAISIGPFPIRWYGLMYILGAGTAWFLGNYRLKYNSNKFLVINQEQFLDLALYVVFGLLLGARIGYMVFYQTAAFIAKPWEVVYLWQGGMSFHGGFIGALIAIIIYCYKFKQDFFVLADFVVPLVPPALFFGRMGNFINGELWGKVTDVPWGVVFPTGGPLPRHPSQLYEGFLEGIMLFIILWFFSKRTVPRMATTGMFLVGYGLFRSAVEFCRVPDQHMGYLALNWLTMGQLLSLPMVIFGVIFLVIAYSKNNNIKYCYR